MSSQTFYGKMHDLLQVFIMDKVTVKVMAASCKMSDITDQGVSRKILKFNTNV